MKEEKIKLENEQASNENDRIVLEHATSRSESNKGLGEKDTHSFDESHMTVHEGKGDSRIEFYDQANQATGGGHQISDSSAIHHSTGGKSIDGKVIKLGDEHDLTGHHYAIADADGENFESDDTSLSKLEIGGNEDDSGYSSDRSHYSFKSNQGNVVKSRGLFRSLDSKPLNKNDHLMLLKIHDDDETLGENKAKSKEHVKEHKDGNAGESPKFRNRFLRTLLNEKSNRHKEDRSLDETEWQTLKNNLESIEANLKNEKSTNKHDERNSAGKKLTKRSIDLDLNRHKQDNSIEDNSYRREVDPGFAGGYLENESGVCMMFNTNEEPPFDCREGDGKFELEIFTEC